MTWMRSSVCGSRSTSGVTGKVIGGAFIFLFALLVFGFAQTTTTLAPGSQGKIAFLSAGEGIEDIFVMNPDGTERTRLTFDGANKGSLEWSPDGAQIVFSTEFSDQFDIYLMNSDGTGLSQLMGDPADDFAPSFSPDGTRLCFASKRDGNDEIYLINLDGSGLKRITDHPSVDAWCEFSPDGTQIAFESRRSGNRDIWVMNQDGTEPRQLTEASTPDIFPAWSPDGDRIAYTGQRQGDTGGTEIFVMGSNGSGEHPLTDYELGGAGYPTWSPDGTKIAFQYVAGADDPTFAITIMNSDGTGLVSLDSPFNDIGPEWQPVAQVTVPTTTRPPITSPPTSKPSPTTLPPFPATIADPGMETWRKLALWGMGGVMALVLVGGFFSYRAARKEGRPWR